MFKHGSLTSEDMDRQRQVNNLSELAKPAKNPASMTMTKEPTKRTIDVV